MLLRKGMSTALQKDSGLQTKHLNQFHYPQEVSLSFWYFHLMTMKTRINSSTDSQYYLSYSISLVALFVPNPCNNHWNLFKCVQRYVKGTNKRVIFYIIKVNQQKFHVFASSWADDIMRRPHKCRNPTWQVSFLPWEKEYFSLPNRLD